MLIDPDLRARLLRALAPLRDVTAAYCWVSGEWSVTILILSSGQTSFDKLERELRAVWSTTTFCFLYDGEPPAHALKVL